MRGRRHDLDLRLVLPKEAPHTGERAPRAEPRHEVGDFGAVTQDLRAGGREVDAGVVLVLVLHGHEDVGVLRRHLRGHRDRAVAAEFAGGERQLRTEELEQVAPLDADAGGHHAVHGVTVETPDQGQGESGVAGGGLQDALTGLQRAIGAGRVDHRLDDAVLDGAGRVLPFELDPDRHRLFG